MTRRRIGLALGSGSARGWAHIGAIDALTGAGIEPEIVCGTSIGALVGAAYVAGRLADLRLIDVRFSGGGLIDGKEVVEFLRRLGIAAPIESYARIFAAIATDLATGREIWLQSGPIHEAVRASISLPAIFSPTRIDDQWLVDGGLSNPVPVSVCRALGAEVIIAINLNGDLLGRRFEAEPDASAATAAAPVSHEFLDRVLSHLPAPMREQTAQIAAQLLPQQSSAPGYFDVLANSINIMQDHITRTRLAGEPPHVMLLPRLRDMGLMEFDRAKEAIAEGRICVEQALPMLRRYL